MLLSRSATVFTLALIVLAFPRIEFTALAQETEAERDAKNNTVQDAPPPSCHVTLPSAGSAGVSCVPEAGTGLRYGKRVWDRKFIGDATHRRNLVGTDAQQAR